jgi:hypothetical protein
VSSVCTNWGFNVRFSQDYNLKIAGRNRLHLSKSFGGRSAPNSGWVVALAPPRSGLRTAIAKTPLRRRNVSDSYFLRFSPTSGLPSSP